MTAEIPKITTLTPAQTAEETRFLGKEIVR